MQVSDLQKFLARVQIRLDKKFGKNDSKELSVLSWMTKLTEEVWELAEQVMLRKWRQDNRKWDFDIHQMELEIADVVLSVSMIAQAMDIDIESALQKKMDDIKSKRS